MNFRAIRFIVGLLLVFSSLTMVPPAIIAGVTGGGALRAFGLAIAITLLAGAAVALPVRHVPTDLRVRDGFLVVALCWSVVSLSAALPLLLVSPPQISLTDAVFEAVSGLTTTGATVITDLDRLSPATLFYRQELQWLGGMGILVLAVAVLPMLRIGGMQIYRAETPGPMKDNKLTPRITETAKALWYIYLGLTILCIIAFMVAGMRPFDAIAHAFSTIATGGFSPYDASIGHFDSALIEAVCIIFMAIAGVNFGLHYLAWRRASIAPYAKNSEVRTYLAVLGTMAVVVAVYLAASQTFENFGEALRHGLFQVVSVGTSTGFVTDAFYLWPGFLPALLIIVSFMAGCAGSTSGGMKVIRVLLLYKQGVREIKRLIHPRAEMPIKVGGRTMPPRVMDAIWGFFSLYMVCFVVMSLILAGTGLDLVTAVSAVAACINNLGPALGEAGPHFADLNDTAKWVLSFAMLLGRLEIFTLLVLFTPGFWRD